MSADRSTRARSGLPRLLAGLDPAGSTMTLAEHARSTARCRVGGPRADRGDRAQRAARARRRRLPDRAQAPRRGRAPRRVATLVVNGSETEPASARIGCCSPGCPTSCSTARCWPPRTVGARE